MTQAIPFATYLFLFLGVCTSLIGPIALLVWYCRRHRVSAFPALIGAAAFYLAVMVLETRFALWLVSFEAVRSFLTGNAVIYCLWGGLMAGVFEETARLLCLTFLVRRYRGVRTGFVYGIGHGGMEAVLFVGLSYLIALVTVIWAGIGGVGALPGVLGVSEGVYAAIASAPSTQYLAGALERVFAIAIHLGNSVLVCLAVSRRGYGWLYPVAIALHALSNVGASLYQYGVWTSLLSLELYTAVVAAGICLFSWTMLQISNRTHSDLLRYDPR